MEELLSNLQEAVEGCLTIEVAPPVPDVHAKEIEIAV